MRTWIVILTAFALSSSFACDRKKVPDSGTDGQVTDVGQQDLAEPTPEAGTVRADPGAFAAALGGFATEKEALAYLNPVIPQPNVIIESGIGAGSPVSDDGEIAEEVSELAAAEPASADAPADGAENESITNVQEEGVDEGGIVKNIGPYLVILRHGRVFAVDTSGQENRLTSSIPVPLDASLNRRVWYDEMLVNGRNIYVIGYRYMPGAPTYEGRSLGWIRGATEISSFRLEENGELTRLGTGFLESNDYYSGTNYASRLIDGQFVVYKPFRGFRDFDRLPRQIDYIGDGQFQALAPMMGYEDVVFLPQDVFEPNRFGMTLHTVIVCDLPHDGTLDCRARGVVGPSYSQRYVSRNYLYLLGGGHTVAFSLTSDAIAIHNTGSATGRPSSQFGFSERDGELRVVVNGGQGVQLLRLKIEDFDDLGQQPVRTRTLSNGQTFRERWMGDWYVAAIREGWQRGKLLAYHATTDEVDEREFSANVTRIDAMPGIGALIAHPDGRDLHLDTLVLSQDNPPQLHESAKIENAREGESRSHGFFFRPGADGGIFGLPVLGTQVRQRNRPSTRSASIGFFSASPNGEINPLGFVRAEPPATQRCEISCHDWYGNTRPIFLRGRIIALMGSELAEAAIEAGALSETKPRVLLTY